MLVSNPIEGRRSPSSRPGSGRIISGRPGSAKSSRPGSASTTCSARPGSARVGPAAGWVKRIGSARCHSDARQHPKVHTGRPSSAPIPGRSDKTRHATTKIFTDNKAKDLSHISLSIEGKS
ncbi:unnamed protein product, partial [Meganyctiphanes norvegica]